MPFPQECLYFILREWGLRCTEFHVCLSLWGRIGFDGDVEAEVAGRGAAGLVKSGTIVIGNDYDYAYAA